MTASRRCIAASALCGSTVPAFGAAAPDVSVSGEDYAAPEPTYSSYVDDHFPQNVFSGDTHLHTSWSAGAGLAGATLGPEAADRVARDEAIESQTGLRFKLIRPLDFVVVADDAESIGIADYLTRGDPLVPETEVGRRWADYFASGNAIEVADEWGAANARGEDPFDSPEMTARVRDGVIENAERYCEPGVFTTFIGREWTSGPGSNNLHRNVIFRDGGDRTRRVVPFSALDSDDPEDLWDYLASYEQETGGRVLAIPHNGNLSNGMMFMLETFDGEPFDAAYAERRRKFEPLVEVTEPEGTSEAHPLLSPDDAFADFEIMDASDLTCTEPKEPWMLRTEYAREALELGLAKESRLGVNPFEFGMIGSTDSHNAIPSTREQSWFGKIYFVEPSGHRKDGIFVESAVDPRYPIYDRALGASGLAAEWATENTREAIRDAMKRRGVFATTGTRLRVIGGWDVEAAEVDRPDFAAHGYEAGVPMGGDLADAPEGAAPTFMVRALRDPDGPNLDRVQVIKGWTGADGAPQEKICDVAWSGDRDPDAEGNLPPVGDTVDVESATYTNAIGAPFLQAYWQDPEFNPAQRAFYYVRVPEIPTPRWTTYDAAFFGIERPENQPASQ